MPQTPGSNFKNVASALSKGWVGGFVFPGVMDICHRLKGWLQVVIGISIRKEKWRRYDRIKRQIIKSTFKLKKQLLKGK